MGVSLEPQGTSRFPLYCTSVWAQNRKETEQNCHPRLHTGPASLQGSREGTACRSPKAKGSSQSNPGLARAIRTQAQHSPLPGQLQLTAFPGAFASTSSYSISLTVQDAKRCQLSWGRRGVWSVTPRMSLQKLTSLSSD